ncbi:cytochrome P450 4d1-like [Chironomus tepperi]|uniref:cytochrome P450 4d1-like n=1 Tax=Chironomus tepperi TaxID=113505 RepID=UPI00391F0652
MLVAVVSLLVILWLIFKSDIRKVQLAWNFPGPTALPIVGNGLQLINKTTLEFVDIIHGYIKNHGKFFRIWIGNELVTVFMEPKDVQQILTDVKLITKAKEYKYLEPWLKTGLLTSTNQKWMLRRKALTPAFHFKILDEFVEIFDKQSSILIEKLKAHDGKGSFNAFPVVALAALDVICETAMGVSLNTQSGSESQYVKNVNELADIVHRRSYDIIERSDMLFKFTKAYKRQQLLISELHKFTDTVISSRRKELKNKKSSGTESIEDEFFGKKKKALLDLLLEIQIDGKYLSDDDIREEIDTFMFEGHDTTASALAFTLYNIAKHEDIQRKCYEEIQNIVGSDGRFNMKTLNEMTYLDLVCKESLRLYPSVPIFGRKVTEEMKVCGKLLPKDTTILILPYYMARDPTIWNNPEEFIPERFSGVKDSDDANIFGYVPFSGGYRNCIGQKFAMLEIKATISKILLNYKIKLEKNFKPQDSLELVIKSKNGIMIQIESRK